MKSTFIYLFVIIKILDIEAEHVHIKIHVPKLINRHVHTKTVWVYVHSPPKKKKNNYPTKQNYLNENYNSWSTSYEESYNNNQDQGEPPFYDDYRETDYSGSLEDNTPPQVTKFETGVTGYSYPPQYQVYENGNNVFDNDNDNDSDNNSKENSSYERVEYNEGHHHAGKLQTGHLYTDDEYGKFYNNKIEETPRKEQAVGGSNNIFKYIRSNYLLKLLSG